MPFQSGPPPASASETQTESERTLTIACCCLVGIAFFLRTLGRYALKQKLGATRAGKFHYLGLDDIFNFLAILTYAGLATAVMLAIDRGMGQHIEAVLYYKGPQGIDDYSLAIYISAIFYNTVLGMVKLSVLSLYRRILRGVQSNILPKINWAAFALVSANTLANVLVAAFQCHPIQAAFDSSIDGTCINANAFYLGNAITGIITDSIVYGLSIPIVRPLQMDQKRKIVTLLTLLVGAFAVITSCIRLAFLPALLTSDDPTWAMGVPMDWSMVEPMVGIIVSSVPAITAIRHLFRKPGARNTSDNSLKSGGHLHSNGHIKLGDIPGHMGDNKVSVGAGGYGGPARKGHRGSIGAPHGLAHTGGYGLDGESGKDILGNDSSSEEHLVEQGKGGVQMFSRSLEEGQKGIARTTEIEVSYDRKN